MNKDKFKFRPCIYTRSKFKLMRRACIRHKIILHIRYNINEIYKRSLNLIIRELYVPLKKNFISVMLCKRLFNGNYYYYACETKSRQTKNEPSAAVT